MPEIELNGLPREVRQLHTKGMEALQRDNFDYAIELLMQVGVLTRQAALLERLGEDVHQLVELKRFGNEIRRAKFDHVDRVFYSSVTGDDVRYDRRVALQCRFDDAAPIDARQTQIRNDDIEGKTVECFEGGLAVVGLSDLEAFVCKSFGYNTSQSFLVVHEEQVRHGCQSIDAVPTGVKIWFGLHA